MRHALFLGFTSLSVALGALSWFSACSSDDAAEKSPDAATAADALARFRALEGELVATCGGAEGSCHVNGTTQGAQKWLGEGDHYETIKAYRGVLPASGNEANSILLTQIRHRGPALSDAPKLRADVLAWTQAELAVRGTKLPGSEPIVAVGGTGTISLAGAIDDIEGARIDYTGSANGSLYKMSGMTITAPAGKSLIVEAPYFVLIPEAGKVVEDPVANGFTGTITVPAGGSALLFGGNIELLGATRNAKVRVYFKRLEDGGPKTGPSFACNALSAFTTNAVPVFQQTVPLVEGGTSSCYFCHSGGDESARAAFDLAALTTDNGAACSQAKLHVNFTAKDMSRILQNPQGIGNVTHPVGGLSANHPVVLGIKAWVDAETP